MGSKLYRSTLVSLAVGLLLLIGALGRVASAEDPVQYSFNKAIPGISAVQLAWWFQHIADKNGAYWKPLSPGNESIHWVVTPTDDAHQIIGSLFESDQNITGGDFSGDKLHMQIQFQDYITQPRRAPGAPPAFMPTFEFPQDYIAPYPSPLSTADPNGFNQHMLFYDGHGFCPGRILWSWINTGNDDTGGGGEPSIDLWFTFYLHYMEGANRPPALTDDGYYYTAGQVEAIWGAWEEMLDNIVEFLPAWFSADTQDAIARSEGWTVSSVIDTGVLRGANSKMEVWWWMHGMGDEPGNAYVFWHPTVHHTIRWLPGYSPAEVAKAQGLQTVPNNKVLPGIIYPDLQGANIVQNGGGMMAYPVSMSPVPGVYKTLDPMMVVTKAQVDAWEAGNGPRYPEPTRWLLHQWEDVPGGLIHRSTVLAKLPLTSPITQAGFYSEHQLQEGLFKGLGYLPTLYHNWKKTQHGQHVK